MNPRSIRRAADRKTLEEARKIVRAGNDNQANSESKSAIEPVTGLTGRTVLLPSEDADAYKAHLLEYQTEYKPEGLRERELVQSLADGSWRLRRISGLEMAIYAQGFLQFKRSFDEHPADLRRNMIELQTHITYEKQLRNLQLQEARLHRRYQKELAELRSLQKERSAQQKVHDEPRALKASNGFEFSNLESGTLASLPASNHVTVGGHDCQGDVAHGRALSLRENTNV